MKLLAILFVAIAFSCVLVSANWPWQAGAMIPSDEDSASFWEKWFRQQPRVDEHQPKIITAVAPIEDIK